MSSKPTVWDGAFSFHRCAKWIFLCSKPTAWDGDKSAGLGKTRTGILRLVLSPLRGMAMFFSLLFQSQTLSLSSSKPTVWDGDTFGSDHIFTPLFCSEPTVWDGDVSNLQTSKRLFPEVPSPLCGMATASAYEKKCTR